MLATGPDALIEPLRCATVTVTRSQLVVRSGAVAVWAASAASRSRNAWGHLDDPPPFDRRVFPEPGRSAVAVLRAESYELDLEGLLVEASASSRRTSGVARVLLKPNLVEFLPGSSINTDPRLVVAAANAMRRLGALSASSSPKARATDATRRRSRSPRGCRRRSTTRACASSTSTKRRSFGRRSRAATWDWASSGSRVSYARPTSSSRCRS